MKLSLLIVAHNEEQQIADCIKSAAFADEIVVLLDRSTDETGSIAEALGARLLKGAWPDEGERRSAGIDGCSGDWIFELDGDERVTPELAGEITKMLPTTSADYGVIPFRNYVGGRYVQYGWGAYNGVDCDRSWLHICGATRVRFEDCQAPESWDVFVCESTYEPSGVPKS